MFSVCLFGASLCLITTETNKIQDWRISSRFMWKPVSHKCSWSALLCHCMKLVSNFFKSYLGSYSFILTFMKYWEIYHMSTVHLIFGKHFTERVFYTDPCQIPFFQFHTADKISNERKNTTQTWGCVRTHTDLNHTVVDGCVLLLSQHYQGDDNDSRYDDTAYHQANNSTLVRADVFSEENLSCKREQRKENVTKKKKENGRWHSTISW